MLILICSSSANSATESFFPMFFLLKKPLHSRGLQLLSPSLGLDSYLRPPWKRNIRSCHLLERVEVPRPLPRDGGMAEEHGTQKARQLPRAWNRGRRQTKQSLKSELRRVRSWTLQNERCPRTDGRGRCLKDSRLCRF